MKNFYKNLIAKISVIAVVLGLTVAVMAATTVNLGTADNFAILAGSGITIGGAVNTSAITGDIGTFPTATITGIGNAVLTGTNHAGDATTQSAKTALSTAFTDAGQPATTVITELGSSTKFAGVYDSLSGTFGITGTLTLDGQGDPNAVFIFRTGTTLITAGASNVTLINSAQACNVFWQVGSSATLGASSFFKGNILADQSVGLGTSAQVEGRVLAKNASVTLDGSNIITKATCVTPPPTSGSSGSGGTIFALIPNINITKIPSPLTLPLGPGPVTFTYAVTNIGQVPMTDVWVKDDKCSPVTYVSGDINNNARLGLTETWTYRCTKTVSQTETNTATAHGSYNGWDTYDNANATVAVNLSLVPPLIHLVKTPNTYVLPAGGGAVTYSYAVTNPGTAPLSNVSITDDKCTGLPGRVIGHPGDLNKNDLLESNETWSFTCQSNITKTTTNIGTAEGHANGMTAIDFSPAVVVVSLPTTTTTITPSFPDTGFPPSETNTPWIIAVLAGILAVVSASIVTLPFLRRNLGRWVKKDTI